MFGAIARSLVGTRNDRVVKSLLRQVQRINELEKDFETKSDEALRALTGQWRQQLADGDTTLDKLMPEAFAAVREAAKRTLGQRHYDVQLVGGLVLHQGKIAEMKTGEGKTLVSTLPVYLNALAGKGVHVVTVNDYLARRDSDWMGNIHRFLGLTVGVITNEKRDQERREAYACDITYGTNNEFGFDYLRDNMKFSTGEMVQREPFFAIVDEVDSILIDEARTPLIISGPAADTSTLYAAINAIIPELTEEDFEKDEKQRQVNLTEDGMEHAEQLLRDRGLLEGGMYDAQNITVVHHVNQALRAHKLFQLDKDYIVKDDRVILIDEFTGRMMEGRRFSDGLHQALEAKEGATIQRENQTLASITFQNYFRLYPKLAGMTGTATTEATEFGDIYGLDVVEIPTNVTVQRLDQDDEVYRTREEKTEALIAQIKACQEKQQPVLVGTTSIERSEELSRILKKQKIKHAVLNARFHEQEAQIVAQAGRPGAVTIATNMAGRGTDIQLGGNYEMMLSEATKDLPEDSPERETIAASLKDQVEADRALVKAAGGLYVIATERHESRRIDNQLRGRSGRQGDPGESKFYLSLQDDLMRIFGSERIDSMLQRLGLEKGEAIIHSWINKAIERAQKKVEEHNYDIRKNVLKFDNVMNDQRKEIYSQRREIMQADDVSELVRDMRHEVLADAVQRAIPQNTYVEQWDVEGLIRDVKRLTGLDLPLKDWANEEGIAEQEIEDRVIKAADERMAERTARFTPDIMRDLEKQVLLQILDEQWKNHLLTMDHLRAGIGLRAYAQRDPLNEYKSEAFEHFDQMLNRLRETVTMLLANVELKFEQPVEDLFGKREPQPMHAGRTDPALAKQPRDPAAGGETDVTDQPRVTRSAAVALDPNDPSTWGRVSRNALCPCGSGKKYKHCHGMVS